MVAWDRERRDHFLWPLLVELFVERVFGEVAEIVLRRALPCRLEWDRFLVVASVMF